MCRNLSNVKCSVCHTYGAARYVDLPVFGSEGINLCPSCKVIVCNQIHDLSMDYLRRKRDSVLASKRAEVQP